MSENSYIWVDLETSDLRPRVGSIIEIYAFVTDGDLNEIQYPAFRGLLSFTPETSPYFDPVAKEMHVKSGLYDVCVGELPPPREQPGEMLVYGPWADMMGAFVKWVRAAPVERPLLAGSSVHFDREWILDGYPALKNNLHYRIFDVSTLWAAYEQITGEPPIEEEEGDLAHRAQDDVRRSLTIARNIFARARSCATKGDPSYGELREAAIKEMDPL